MQMNELGFYTLAGAPKSPGELIGEVGDAELQAIGACFISERLNIKKAATLCGAVGGRRPARSTRRPVATLERAGARTVAYPFSG